MGKQRFTRRLWGNQLVITQTQGCWRGTVAQRKGGWILSCSKATVNASFPRKLQAGQAVVRHLRDRKPWARSLWKSPFQPPRSKNSSSVLASTELQSNIIDRHTLCVSIYVYLSMYILFIYLLIYSFIYLLVHLFIHLSIHLFIHSFIYLFIYLFIYSFIYSFIPFIHLFIHSFIHLSIYSFFYSFIHSSIY